VSSVIQSWDELRSAAPVVLAKLEDDPRGMVAALANPLLVLERLGWVVEGAARQEIVDRLRLGPGSSERLAQLRAAIREAVGHDVDPQSPEDIRRLLDGLGLDGPGEHSSDTGGYRQVRSTPQHHLPVHIPPLGWRPEGPGEDPLDAWAGSHPVLDLALEYRRLDAARPAFAPPGIVEAVLSGRVQPAVTGARARFQPAARRRSPKARKDE